MLLVSFETPGSLAATAGDQANQFGKQAPPAAVPPLAIVHSRSLGAIDLALRTRRPEVDVAKKDAPAMISPGQRSRELN
jgi:hypothetical protein